MIVEHGGALADRDDGPSPRTQTRGADLRHPLHRPPAVARTSVCETRQQGEHSTQFVSHAVARVTRAQYRSLIAVAVSPIRAGGVEEDRPREVGTDSPGQVGSGQVGRVPSCLLLGGLPGPVWLALMDEGPTLLVVGWSTKGNHWPY